MKGVKRNNAVGVKGKSGRKKFSEELLKRAIELNYEEISKDILTKHLLAIKESNTPDFKNVKDLALPIVLKGMTDKSESKQEIIIQASNEIMKKYNDTPPDTINSGE